MFGTSVITFRKRSGKFLSDLEARYHSIWKINIKMLIEKHVRMFLTCGAFFFISFVKYFVLVLGIIFELVLID